LLKSVHTIWPLDGSRRDPYSAISVNVAFFAMFIQFSQCLPIFCIATIKMTKMATLTKQTDGAQVIFENLCYELKCFPIHKIDDKKVKYKWLI